MVNIYESLRDENGNMVSGRTKLFILSTEEDGSIRDFLSGYAIVPESQGSLFITDEHVVEQIDKLQFKGGDLSVKYGEELIPPVKSEKELKREALLRQIAELDAEEDSEDTEEHTDDVFKEYDELINDDFRQEPTE